MEQKKRPGPFPGPRTNKITVLIEPELIDWGKQQPGGLSATLRGLLKVAKGNEGQPKG